MPARDILSLSFFFTTRNDRNLRERERIPPYRLPAAFRPLATVIYEAAMDPP